MFQNISKYYDLTLQQQQDIEQLTYLNFEELSELANNFIGDTLSRAKLMLHCYDKIIGNNNLTTLLVTDSKTSEFYKLSFSNPLDASKPTLMIIWESTNRQEDLVFLSLNDFFASH